MILDCVIGEVSRYVEVMEQDPVCYIVLVHWPSVSLALSGVRYWLSLLEGKE